jgi:hypothetical protein
MFHKTEEHINHMSYTSCFTNQRFIKDQSPVTSINTSVLSILVVSASSSASDFN